MLELLGLLARHLAAVLEVVRKERAAQLLRQLRLVEDDGRLAVEALAAGIQV